MKYKVFISIASAMALSAAAIAKTPTYTNPIVDADYSDPDLIAAPDGKGYYLTASSFVSTPALPILYSDDLVNWEVVNHAIPTLEPHEWFDGAPKHGKGVWAPSIRYHDGLYYILWGDPDLGVYMVTASDPRGRWSKPQLIIPGKGLIDACPLWDDDGRAYVVNAWASSRSHFNTVLTIREMTTDLREAIGQPVIVYDGNDDGNHTTEGPKLYKRDGKYYIMAPAGGVVNGWQIALRADDIYGPYESKTVMAQGDTKINGPHQGGWVTTPEGEDWFVNFQDKGWLGRVLHLNPMRWEDGWPVVGIDNDGDGCGEPVASYAMPKGGVAQAKAGKFADAFDGTSLPKRWQWAGNYDQTFGFPSTCGYARVYGWEMKDGENLWTVPNLLLQKCHGEEFVATAHCKVSVKSNTPEAMAGLVMFGLDYAGIALEKRDGQLLIVAFDCFGAEGGGKENRVTVDQVTNAREYESGLYPNAEVELWLRAKVGKGHKCTFAWSYDGKKYHEAKGLAPFVLREGKWVGARMGVFATNPEKNDRCWLDIIDFTVE